MTSIRSLNSILELSKGFDTVSFDLFGTLIHRVGLTYEQIQDLSAQWLLMRLDRGFAKDANGVRQHRADVTNTLRESISIASREPLLDDVLLRVVLAGCAGLGIDAALRLAREAVEFELSLEKVALEPHSEARSLIQCLRAEGKRVIALSDMYFSRADLLSLLSICKLDDCFDAIYVSSDIGATKHEGLAFHKVAADLGATPSSILHVGDNIASDVNNARLAGFGAALIRQHFSALVPSPVHSAIDKLVDIASDIMAAFLVSCLVGAREARVRKIFFFSRDATVFCRIWQKAHALNVDLAQWGAGIDVRELCVSRASTTWLSVPYSDCFAAVVAARVSWLYGRAISYAEFLDHFGFAIPHGVFRSDSCLTPLELAKRLSADGLEDDLRVKVRDLQTLVVRYLKQEGVIGGGDVVLADIGYSGTVAVSINDYLLREEPKSIAFTRMRVKLVASNGFLSKNQLNARQTAVIERGVIFAREDLPLILAENFSWLESMFKDFSRGPLLGYAEREGRIVPEFAPALGNSIDVLRRIEEAAVVKLSRGLGSLGFGTPGFVASLRRRAIAAFHHPDVEFVNAFLELSQEVNGIGSSLHPVVESVSQMSVPGHIGLWKRDDYWISGCLTASGLPFLIHCYDSIKYINTQLRRMRELARRAKGFAARALARFLKCR